MSRSIHTTWKKLILENKFQYSDNKIKKDRLYRMRDELYEKEFIKNQTLLERRQGDILNNNMSLLDPTAIKIIIQDEGKYVHYPASRNDLIEVVKRMPPNVLSGIDSIILCLGKEYQEKFLNDNIEEERDPYTGRLSCDNNGVLYSSPSRGTYFIGTCKIYLYAYVYNEEDFNFEVIKPLLRLQLLSTFAHEIAHHDDNMRRTRRGRWLGLSEYKCENYAEMKQKEWTKEVIIPYLLNQYPSEYDNLLKWIEEHGGVKFTLGLKEGQIGNKLRIVSNNYLGIENLFINVINDKPQRETILEFALGLHNRGYYEECLEALDSLLEKNPKDSEAIGIKSDTLIYMERYEEAELTALECLSINRQNIDSLVALCNVRQYQKDWKSLKVISLSGINAVQNKNKGTDCWEFRAFSEMNIIALLYIGEFNVARETINLLPENGKQGQRKNAYLALMTLVEGNCEKAIESGKNILELDEVIPPVEAISKWVCYKATQMLGISNHKYTLNKYEKNALEKVGIIGLIKC